MEGVCVREDTKRGGGRVKGRLWSKGGPLKNVGDPREGW